MKIASRWVCLGLFALLVFPSAAAAESGALGDLRAEARHNLEIAKIELRLYYQVEYPRQQRHLDAQIKLTEAEIKAYRERLHEYEPFGRFRTGRPLLTTIQNLRLCLLEAELRLQDLREERIALTRFHSDQWRLLELRVQAARVRVAEIEAAAAGRHGQNAGL